MPKGGVKWMMADGSRVSLEIKIRGGEDVYSRERAESFQAPDRGA